MSVGYVASAVAADLTPIVLFSETLDKAADLQPVLAGAVVRKHHLLILTAHVLFTCSSPSYLHRFSPQAAYFNFKFLSL